MTIFFVRVSGNMETPLSKEEAVYFLREILSIELPVQKLQKDKAKFLNEIVLAYIEKIPFQNLHLLAAAYRDHNHVPTWAEIKEAMMSGSGGICYTIDVFMKVLLETLGYKVYFAACKIKEPSDHITTVVQNLSHEGSRHLVDLNGYPNFEVVPLDFPETSPVYNFSFCKHYFKKEGEETILRYNVKGLERCHENLFETIHLAPQELPHFSSAMHRIYTNQEESGFLQALRAISYRGRKCVTVRGTTLFLENDLCTLQKTTLESQERTIAILKEHFPQIGPNTVSDALAYLDR